MGRTAFSPPHQRPRPEISKCAYCGCEYSEFQTKCDKGCGAPIQNKARNDSGYMTLDEVRALSDVPPNPVSMDWISS